MYKNEEPLVSVVIGTYNSSQFIVETLDSVRNQSYKNIELIITDDGSSDDTISICRKWIDLNKDTLKNAEILTVEKNTGIPANCNRGISVAKGDWIKLFAGDDILHEECIRLNVGYVKSKNYPNIILISNLIKFLDGTDHHKGTIIKPHTISVLKEGIDPSTQLKFVLRHYIGNTPSVFIAKKILEEVKFDERIPFMEDRPFAINAIKMGYLYEYMDEVTAYYRISASSLFTSNDKRVVKGIFNDFYKKRRPFVKEYIFPNVSLAERMILNIEFYRRKIIDQLGLNKKNTLSKIIYSLSYKLTPYGYFKKYRKKIEGKEDYWHSRTENAKGNHKINSLHTYKVY